MRIRPPARPIGAAPSAARAGCAGYKKPSPEFEFEFELRQRLETHPSRPARGVRLGRHRPLADECRRDAFRIVSKLVLGDGHARARSFRRAARSRSEALPAGAVFVAGDVASASGVTAIAAAALDALGGLDILVNNAGGASGFPQGTASIPDGEWQGGFALNLFAAIRLTNALLPSLRESKAGAIVNISSGAATMAIGAIAHYCAAKAALDSYSAELADLDRL